MEDAYRRARKSVALVIGLLLVALFVGIEPTEKAAVQVFPFHLADTGALPHLLAILLLYLTYNMSMLWGIVNAKSDRHKLEAFDFKVLVVFSSACLCIYSYLLLLPITVENIESIVSGANLVALLVFVIAAMLGTLIAGLSIFSSVVRTLRVQLSEQKDKDRLSHRLTNQDWILIYNPKTKNARKIINFSSSGEIHEGHNDNEHSWRIEDGSLVICREDGSIQNVFEYDERATAFKSTNDPNSDAIRRGIKDQVIIPASSLNSE